MNLTRIGAALMTLAILAALATIWWAGHRWQSAATAVLLFSAGAAFLGNANNHNTTENNEQKETEQ